MNFGSKWMQRRFWRAKLKKPGCVQIDDDTFVAQSVNHERNKTLFNLGVATSLH